MEFNIYFICIHSAATKKLQNGRQMKQEQPVPLHSEDEYSNAHKKLWHMMATSPAQ
jgi:hypothetical protein